MTRTAYKTAPPPADYMRLIREFQLRPMRNVWEYNAAAAIIDRLAIQPEGSLTSGKQDYLDALTLLVQAYDDEHFELTARRLKPLDVLKYLMEQHGMRTVDLGNLLGGNRALASLILNGHRDLSKTHIRIVAEHFKVEPGLFLRP